MSRWRVSRIAIVTAIVSLALATGMVFVVRTTLHQMLVQREKDALTRSVERIMDDVANRATESRLESIDLARQYAAHLEIEVHAPSDVSVNLPGGFVTQREDKLYIAAQSDEGRSTLIFERSLGSVIEIVRRVTTTLAAMLLLVFASLGLGGYTAVRTLRDRITHLQNAVHRFARGELEYRVSMFEPSEFAGLAATLNGMAEQVQQRLKTANQQRRESEAILASMVEGILVLETSLKIRTLNSMAASLLGTRIDRARGQYLYDVHGTGELQAFARESAERQEPMERTLVVDHGEPRYFQVHSSPLEAEAGRARGMLLVLNDITRIKRLESMRRDFVANVSHELKTPITSIRGFVETLLDDEIEDRTQRERFLRIVLRHSSRLQTILEDLLSLSRLEQADHTIPRDQVNLHTLIAQIHEAVERQAREKDMEIRPSVTGDPFVPVNANLIEQAVVNLVDNAIKYGKESTNIALQFIHKADSLQIEVTNLGPPIPQASLPRIFERFYRVDKARSRSFGGTGLGLAIVKHIAMAHEGTITVRSDERSGTTFRMELPMHAPTRTGSVATRAPN